MSIRLLILVCLCSFTIHARVRTGLEILAEQDFRMLGGKRAGAIANQNSVTRERRNLVALMAASKHIKLAAIFSPEHGFSGKAEAGAKIASGKDSTTGVPIYSLHAGPDSHRPTSQMLKGIDALVYDLPEVGSRFWTYTTTLAYMMEAAASARIPIYVLDRPNPINGVAVEGPLLDPELASFIGYGRRPIRHGMTSGELAQFFNAENKIGADLHVVKMEGWTRRMWMDETGLEWITPSPNIRNLTAAALFPATCLVETSQISVGRGTDTPFVVIGSPWFKGAEVAEYLNSKNIPGVRFMSRHFTPAEQPYKGQECDGLDIQLLDRDRYDSARLGLELLAATLKFHPGQFTLDKKAMMLLGSRSVAGLLKKGAPIPQIEADIRKELEAFRTLRDKYLLY